MTSNNLNVHATSAREGPIVSVMISATGTERDIVHLVDQLRFVTTEHPSAHALARMLEALMTAGLAPRAIRIRGQNPSPTIEDQPSGGETQWEEYADCYSCPAKAGGPCVDRQGKRGALKHPHTDRLKVEQAGCQLGRAASCRTPCGGQVDQAVVYRGRTSDRVLSRAGVCQGHADEALARAVNSGTIAKVTLESMESMSEN